MNKERIIYLCDSYLNDNASAEELRELEEVFRNPSLEQEVKTVLSEVYLRFPMDSYANLDKKIADEIFNRIDIPVIQKASVRLWPRVIAAAVAIMIIGASIFYYNARDTTKDQLSFSHSNDVAPGKVGATLTLANGKKIRLSDAVSGEIARESGITISKTADGQVTYEIKSDTTEPNKINTLSTAKGETYILTLPDQSKVYLNAASSLTYTVGLMERGVRKVRLSGEAYFEIAKDKAHPFVVESRGQEVEVLGTHFNVNAYSDEPAILTTLIEGSVKVTSGQNQQVLKPGLQTINNGNTIEVAKANLETITDWKDGDFNLDGLELKAAMRKIGRWYDVEVIYNAVPDNIMSGGWISRDTKLSTILEGIERSKQVHFKLEGRKLYVSR